MGFRSTLTTQHYGMDLPTWFKEKYKYEFIFPEGTLVSSCEFKMYGGHEFFGDYQKALIEVYLLQKDFEVIVAVLSESGKIDKVTITKDNIKYTRMEESEYGFDDDGVASY